MSSAARTSDNRIISDRTVANRRKGVQPAQLSHARGASGEPTPRVGVLLSASSGGSP
jgi:hypothetical protein